MACKPIAHLPAIYIVSNIAFTVPAYYWHPPGVPMFNQFSSRAILRRPLPLQPPAMRSNARGAGRSKSPCGIGQLQRIERASCDGHPEGQQAHELKELRFTADDGVWRIAFAFGGRRH